MAWQLLARDADRSIVGELSGYSLSLTIRYNEVGSWTLAVPPEATPSGWPAPGAGLVILRDGEVIASGEIDEQEFTWSADGPGTGEYRITGDTDLARLGYRIVYPDWDTPWEQQAVAYYTDPGITKAEQLMRRLVNRQCGPISQADRRVPGLDSGNIAGLGLDTSIQERFTPLLDALRKLAFDGGGLAFDVIDTLDGELRFDVWEPVDRSGAVRFGVELGNVTSLTVRSSAPTATAVLLAAQGEKEERTLREYRASGERREVFLDQRQIDGSAAEAEAEYERAGMETLASSGPQTAVSVQVIDTETVQWGRDYRVGDLVSVMTPFGAVSDIVREVQVEVDPTGVETVSSVIGTADASTTDPLASTVRALQRRISQLERAQ